MAQSAKIYVDGFLLNINESSYIVHVELANGRAARYIDPENLPRWMFHSSHAIWLTQEDSPLFDRARRGDEIKNQLMRKGDNNENHNKHVPAR